MSTRKLIAQFRREVPRLRGSRSDLLRRCADLFVDLDYDSDEMGINEYWNAAAAAMWDGQHGVQAIGECFAAHDAALDVLNDDDSLDPVTGALFGATAYLISAVKNPDDLAWRDLYIASNWETWLATQFSRAVSDAARDRRASGIEKRLRTRIEKGTMVDPSRVLHLLGQRLSATIVAERLGLTPTRVRQIRQDYGFAKA